MVPIELRSTLDLVQQSIYGEAEDDRSISSMSSMFGSSTLEIPTMSSQSSLSLGASLGEPNAKPDQNLEHSSTKVGSDQTGYHGESSMLHKLYVFLVANVGEYRKLCQLEAQGKNDDDFFLGLRRQYLAARSRIRWWFSIWQYSHCDFYSVSTCINTHVAHYS